MKKIVGFSIIAFGIFIEVMWLGFCFGSIIIGVLLLIFAPRILFFPFNFFLIIGFAIMSNKSYTEYRYQQKGNMSYNRKNQLERYYETLESSKTDSFEMIKKNYRRLMKEYHYDSLVSQGLSEAEIKAAESKSQEINEAYSYIKKLRG